MLGFIKRDQDRCCMYVVREQPLLWVGITHVVMFVDLAAGT